MANILLAYRWSPYTTAAYFAKAFRALGHDVRSIGPGNETATNVVPPQHRYRLTGPHFDGEWGDWDADVIVWIEAGGDWIPTIPRESSVPVVGYFIDSHSRIARHQEAAAWFSHRFVAQRQYAEALGATWLPVACDPDVHTPTRTEPPEYDVAFVGNTYGSAPMYAERRRVLDMLAGRYRCNFASGVYFEDMANVYASARVAFNVSTGGDLNMRVFEAMCSGRPLVTDWVEGLDDAFGGVPPCYTYGKEVDLETALEFALESAPCADSMGEWAQWHIRRGHTYAHRAAQMLAAVGL